MKGSIRFAFDYFKDFIFLFAIALMISVPWYVYEMITVGHIETNGFDTAITIILAFSIYINIGQYNKSKEQHQSEMNYAAMWYALKKHYEERTVNSEGQNKTVHTTSKYALKMMEFIERIEKSNCDIDAVKKHSPTRLAHEGGKES